jgi:YVTN family beta-propeller protein
MTGRKVIFRRVKVVIAIVALDIAILWSILAFFRPVQAGAPTLRGVGAVAAAYNPHDGYLYLLNSNASVSIVDGLRLVRTLQLPGGGYSRLTALDVAPNGDVYVAQWFYDRVFVLRGGQLQATLPRQPDAGPVSGIENGPTVVRANPVNRLIYVATGWTGEPANNGVDVVSGTQVITHVRTGANPQAVEVLPDDGRILVANAFGNSVTVISGTQILATLAVGGYPAAIGIDPVRHLAYVANRNSATVSVVDTLRSAVTATLPTGAEPIGVAVDETSGRAYVVDRMADQVSIVDGNALSAPLTVTVGRNPIAVTAANGYVYVANQLSNTVSVLQGTSVITHLPVGQSPVALTWHPRHGLYVVNFQDASLSLITGTQVITTIEGLPRLSHVSIEPLPSGEAAAADLSGLHTWVFTGRQAVTRVNTLESISYRLWDTPARAPFYEHLKVAHHPVAVNAQGLVFVANRQSDSVSIVSPITGRLAVLYVYSPPYDVEFMPAPGSQRIYAATDAGVAVIESNLISVTSHTQGLAGARALAAWPERQWMIVTRPAANGSRVSFMSDTDGSVIQEIEVCDDPLDVEIDRARSLIYVVCSGSAANAVGVISGTTYLGSVPVGQFPQNIAVNPLNHYAYVAAPLGDLVSVLSGTQLIANISLPGLLPFDVDVDEQSGLVFATGETGNVVAVISGTQLLTTIPTGSYPDAIRVISGTVYVGAAHSASLDIFRWAQAAEAGDDWLQAAPIVSSTVYAAAITSTEDVDWYRLPLDQAGSQVTVTLGGLPLDYDLAFLSPLTTTGVTTSAYETLDWGQLDGNGQLQSLGSAGNLLRLRNLKIGGPHVIGTNGLLDPEVLTDQTWESGEYYVAVWGHNGAHSDRPYTLRVEISLPDQPVPEIVPVAPVPIPPFAPDPTVRALIVAPLQRFSATYGLTRTTALSAALLNLASAVSGTLVNLDNYPDTRAAYVQWDSAQGRESARAANVTADVIKAKLNDLLTHYYTQTEYLVIAGGDNVIPFRRVPDAALIANERSYFAGVDGGSPMAARLRQGYYLSDDFYAGYHPLPGRADVVYLPEYAIGRLVETPEEIGAAIDAFLASTGSVTPAAGLVTGYDFLIDEAAQISATLGARGVPVTPLIDDAWSADQLRPLLLTATHDLISLNGHFNHQALVAADLTTVITRGEILNASAGYSRAIAFSVGCQSGLSVPDEDALGGDTALTQDFAQTFAQRGAAYVGNTGYGYGDSNTIGFSENLALKFAQQLSAGSIDVGHALARAKQQYYAEAGYASFGDYDAKALSEATLYGLPMRRVQWPAGNVVQRPSKAGYSIGPAQLDGLYAALPVTLTPALAVVTVTDPLSGSVLGQYYHANGEIQVNPGRPVQPRTSIDLLAALPAGQAAHGAMFLGGRYADQAGFDPLVSRIVSDTGASEPPFAIEQWYPSPLHAVNRVQLGSRLASQKLVVMPAQYLAATGVTGTARLYSELRYEVLHTPLTLTGDFLPPAIWQVEVVTSAQTIRFTVTVTDESDIDRVVVAYDDGAGEWRAFDLARDDAEHWSGAGPASVRQAVVQAIDPYGNVAISDNKGIYFSAVGLALSPGQAAGARPDRVVAFRHVLTNTGAGAETFVLAAQAAAGWPLQVVPTLAPLAPGLTTTLVISVNVPPKVLSGTQTLIVLTATALSNQNVFAAVTDFITVTRAPGVILSPGRQAGALPGETVTFTHWVTNTGNASETLLFDIDGGLTITPASAWLAPEETTALSAAVQTPVCALSGTVKTANLTARSSDGQALSSAGDSIVVSRTTGIDVPPGKHIDAAPGQRVTISHVITNSGNYTDAFQVSVSAPPGWLTPPPFTAALPPCAGGSLFVTLTVPLTAQVGLTHTAAITVTRPADEFSGVLERRIDDVLLVRLLLYLPLVRK